MGSKAVTKLLPFEKVILNAVGESLPESLKGLYKTQVGHVNKVQRLLAWNEIELYCMRWMKVRWPEESLFVDRNEFLLGSGVLTSTGTEVQVDVWAVGGHVFSIESKNSLKPFRDESEVSLTLSRSAA